MKSPTAIDLYCGAGGLSLGLKQAGFTVLVGADADRHAVETHRANLGGLGFEGDLSAPDSLLAFLRLMGIRRVDLVAGGVPCQPFSRAGRSKIRSLVTSGQRPEEDSRAQLWRTFLTVVDALKPRAVLFENVPDIAVWDDGALVIDLSESLRDLGFRSPVATVLDAFRYGVPQHRARLFVVAVRGGIEFDWPKPMRGRNTVSSAIGDLPQIPPGQREYRIPYEGPTTPLQKQLRKDLPSTERGWVSDHISRHVRPDDAEAFKLLTEGQTYRDLPDRLRRYRSDIFHDKYKRLAWDELSRSITAHIAKDGYWYIHPQQNRTLSIREAARLQTFPDGFCFSGTPSIRLRQIGNAVPPMLARAIGAALVDAITAPRLLGRPPSARQQFRRDLLEWHSRNSRLFPWRAGADEWQVLMAEICLHRTRADQVVPVYRELLRIAPTPRAMVENEGRAREAMQSLGLRWRTDNLIEIARQLVRDWQGRVPPTEAGLRSLPGVGDYVAQAVMTFARGRRGALLDTNTERIVGRVMGRVEFRRWQCRLDLYALAGRDGPDAPFNYALLDLGALVCKVHEMTCVACPVRTHCATAGSQSEDPRGSRSEARERS